MDYITENAPVLKRMGVFFPFIVAAIFKKCPGLIYNQPDNIKSYYFKTRAAEWKWVA